jgi:prophage regulatory protein
MRDIQQITALSKSTIYRLISEGNFPKQVKVGKRAVVWVRSDVSNWMDQRLSAV